MTQTKIIKRPERKFDVTDAWRFPEMQERNARDLAETLLGTMILMPNTIDKVFTIFKTPVAFYLPEHRCIFSAILDLREKGIGIDLLTVNRRLIEKKELAEAGGVMYLDKITSRIASGANVEYHAVIFYQYFISRVCATEIQLIFEELKAGTIDSLDAVERVNILNEKLQRELSRLKNEVRRTGVVLDETVRLFESITPDKPFNTPSEVEPFDSFHGGLRRGALYILGAQAKQGKTSIAIQIACNVAKSKPVLIFTMEMTDVALMSRIIAKESKVKLQELEKGLSEPFRAKAVHSATKEIEGMNFIFQSGAAQTITDVQSCVMQHIKEGIGLIVIDYLQIMGVEPGPKNRTQTLIIGEIIQKLHDLANATQIPILVLSQLNRNIELRGDKTPILSDLRDCGNIEQAADFVFFVYRKEGVPHLLLKADRHYGMPDVEVPMWYDTTGYSFYNFNYAKPSFSNSVGAGLTRPQPNTDYNDHDDVPF